MHYQELLNKIDALREYIVTAKESVDGQRDALVSIGGLAFPWDVLLSSDDGLKKPDTQIIEEILVESGQPMHIVDIVNRARLRGVTFAGSKPPNQMAADKLYNSKRFVSFGNNVWGLPYQIEGRLELLSDSGNVIRHTSSRGRSGHNS